MFGVLKNLKIGVLAGGVSAEREVSLKSGRAVYNALLRRGYNALFIDLQQGDVCEQIRQSGIELAFIALHGGWGENGAIQGMLEIMGIPYTGSGVLASAVSMDKLMSKRLFQQAGLKVPDYLVVESPEIPEQVFEMPVVVKPSREGSSVGVSIVDEREALLEAVKEASRYGWPVLIERYIKGREIQIGILDDEVLGGVEVRPKRRFYDYTAKYTPGETEYILPPEVDESLYDRCKQVGLRAHRAIGCKGATRVDLLVTEDEIYVLEVNTIPGMTETSLLPKIAALSGYSFDELIERIVRLSYREKGHEKA